MLVFLNKILMRISTIPSMKSPDRPEYLRLEDMYTKREINAFVDCKYPPGHIRKETARTFVLLKRVQFKLMWPFYRRLSNLDK